MYAAFSLPWTLSSNSLRPCWPADCYLTKRWSDFSLLNTINNTLFFFPSDAFTLMAFQHESPQTENQKHFDDRLLHNLCGLTHELKQAHFQTNSTRGEQASLRLYFYKAKHTHTSTNTTNSSQLVGDFTREPRNTKAPHLHAPTVSPCDERKNANSSKWIISLNF